MRLAVVLFFTALHVVLCGKVAQAASATGDCYSWTQVVGHLQEEGLNDLRNRKYDDARIVLERANALTSPCEIDRNPADRPAWRWVETKQLLTAAYLGEHWFGEARQTAQGLWNFASSRQLQPLQRRASDLVVTGSYPAAFSLYEAHVRTWAYDPSITDMPGWDALTLGLSSGASGKYQAAVSDLKKAAFPGYKETFYFYGVALTSAGNRCAAYSQLRRSLMDSYTSTSAVDDIVNWVSISAVRLIDDAYLQSSTENETKAILETC